VILPSEAPAPGWSPYHLRLHRHLRRHPALLPQGAPLLLAVSGGQDSMALAALLADLARLHHWRLELWHGDHGWRPESAAQAQALAAWALGRNLPLSLERADPPPAGEAAARHWRYGCLGRLAAQRDCGHVVTGHTASDRAETLLLNLARGCHQRGLTSLGRLRPLADQPNRGDGPGPLLVRPLLGFSRRDTARICLDLGLPICWDSSNLDFRFARNRLRAEVLPVLEELHPGADRRIAALAQRLEEDLEGEDELLSLALGSLTLPQDPQGGMLSRPGLAELGRANRRRLIQHWLRSQERPPLAASDLEELADRLALARGPGQRLLAGAWRLHWDRSTLVLQCPGPPENGDG
jgi:tRNA(Ile)-lysidine synthase